MDKRWISVSLSALCLGYAHWWPQYFALFVFIFLLPIFAQALTVDFTFWHGFCWGIIFFSMQLSAVIHVLLNHTNKLLGITGSFVVIIYCTAHTGLWFYVTQRLVAYKKYNVYWRAFAWVVSTHLFFVFIYRYGMWITGAPLGYFGALFWLPLANNCYALQPIVWIGINGLSLSLITASMVGALWLTTKQSKYLYIIIFLATMYGMSIIVHTLKSNKHVPSWMSTVCWVADDFICAEHPHDRAHRIEEALAHASSYHLQAKIFVLPESALPCALNEREYLLAWWHSVIPSDAWIALGSHRSQQQLVYNCCYATHNSKVFCTYDKIKLFPCTEYLPPIFNTRNKRLKNKICSLFHAENHFTPAPCTSNPVLVAWCPFIPLMCSELFLDTALLANCRQQIMRLCIVNDSWFAAKYMRDLMYLYARVRATAERCPYLYISHDRGIYVTQSGCHMHCNGWYHKRPINATQLCHDAWRKKDMGMRL